MSLSTYTDLKSAIADFLNRQDLPAVIPTFIQLAEAEFNRRIRTFDMLNRSQVSITTQFTQLPTDFRGARAVKFYDEANNEVNIEYVTPDNIVPRVMATNNTSGVPKFYTFIGQSIEVGPVPSGTFTLELAYYQQISALSESTASNWLLTKHPDLYLYGSLLQSAPYLKDDERLGIWRQIHENIIEGIRIEEERATYAAGTPRATSKRGAIG